MGMQVGIDTSWGNRFQPRPDGGMALIGLHWPYGERKEGSRPYGLGSWLDGRG
jgi:hypothetical protein